MKRSTLLKLIDQCLALCEAEKVGGYSGEATKQQVENCIVPELVLLRHEVVHDNLPEDRWLASFANAFKAWNWSYQNPTELFVALTNLHHAYKSSGDIED